MDSPYQPFLHATQCCVSCGNRLDVHQAVKGNYCSDARCLSAQAVSTAREKEALHEQALDQIARDYAQTHFGAPTITARVPSMERNLVKTDPEWLARFRRNLRESIRQAARADLDTADAQSNKETGNETGNEASVEDSSGNSVSISCELCRGNCCAQGADHAFLSAGHIQSRLAKTPGLTAVALYREYLQHLPSQSYEGACVYQGSQGCALPRAVRSDLCNRYECPSRLAFAKTLKRSGDAPVAVIAMDEKNVRRVALMRKN